VFDCSSDYTVCVCVCVCVCGRCHKPCPPECECTSSPLSARRETSQYLATGDDSETKSVIVRRKGGSKQRVTVIEKSPSNHKPM
jgi:hypothetical protein